MAAEVLSAETLRARVDQSAAVARFELVDVVDVVLLTDAEHVLEEIRRGTGSPTSRVRSLTAPCPRLRARRGCPRCLPTPGTRRRLEPRWRRCPRASSASPATSGCSRNGRPRRTLARTGGHAPAAMRADRADPRARRRTKPPSARPAARRGNPRRRVSDALAARTRMEQASARGRRRARRRNDRRSSHARASLRFGEPIATRSDSERSEALTPVGRERALGHPQHDENVEVYSDDVLQTIRTARPGRTVRACPREPRASRPGATTTAARLIGPGSTSESVRKPSMTRSTASYASSSASGHRRRAAGDPSVRRRKEWAQSDHSVHECTFVDVALGSEPSDEFEQWRGFDFVFHNATEPVIPLVDASDYARPSSSTSPLRGGEAPTLDTDRCRAHPPDHCSAAEAVIDQGESTQKRAASHSLRERANRRSVHGDARSGRAPRRAAGRTAPSSDTRHRSDAAVAPAGARRR